MTDRAGSGATKTRSTGINDALDHFTDLLAHIDQVQAADGGSNSESIAELSVPISDHRSSQDRTYFDAFQADRKAVSITVKQYIDRLSH